MASFSSTFSPAPVLGAVPSPILPPVPEVPEVAALSAATYVRPSASSHYVAGVQPTPLTRAGHRPSVMSRTVASAPASFSASQGLQAAATVRRAPPVVTVASSVAASAGDAPLQPCSTSASVAGAGATVEASRRSSTATSATSGSRAPIKSILVGPGQRAPVERQSASPFGKTQKAVSFPAETLSRGRATATPSRVSSMVPSRSQPTVEAVEKEAGTSSSMPAPTASSSSSSSAVASPPPQGVREPAMMLLEFAYLSDVPAPGWLDQLVDKPGYLLDVHVGIAARADPPQKPGPRATSAVRPQVPGGYNPEEEVLHGQVQQTIRELVIANGGNANELEGKLECRFHVRIPIRLSDCGPGPGKGGPPYFRVDVWIEKRMPLQRQPKHELFGRAFVPINNPKLQRRFCTWPVVDTSGKEVAYLTCDYSFGHVPLPVESFKVEEVTSTKAALSWKPPRTVDDRLPILGYRVEARALHRRQSFDTASSLGAAWELVANVEARAPHKVLASSLRGDTRYSFRVMAVNEAGAGEAAEVDATTSPTAPSACGAPRLGVCTGSVLTVEWEPPKDDGGMPIVSYWVMIRPADANAGPAEWSDVGAVKPKEGRVQRADIHCDRLNPQVAEYVCSVAAENAAGQYGPQTAEAALLHLPNPCAASAPVPAQELPEHGVGAKYDPLDGTTQEYRYHNAPELGAGAPCGCGPAGHAPPLLHSAPSHHGAVPGAGVDAAGHYGPPVPEATVHALPPQYAWQPQQPPQQHPHLQHAQLDAFVPPAEGYGPMTPPLPQPDGQTVHRLNLFGEVAYGMEAGSPGVSEKPSFVAPGQLREYDLYGAGFMPAHGSYLDAERTESHSAKAAAWELIANVKADHEHEYANLYGAGYVPDHGHYLDAEVIQPAPAQAHAPPELGNVVDYGIRPGQGACTSPRSVDIAPATAASTHQQACGGFAPISHEEQRAQLQQQLEEKRRLLSMSLVKCKQAAIDSSSAPQDAHLRTALEEAEIDAAGYQAEVAVICQRIQDLDAQQGQR